MSLYSKTAGKNAAHAWIESATSVSSISNAIVQVFRVHALDSNSSSFYPTSTIPSVSQRPIRRFAFVQGSAIIAAIGPVFASEGNTEPLLHARGHVHQRVIKLFRYEKDILSIVNSLLKKRRKKADDGEEDG